MHMCGWPFGCGDQPPGSAFMFGDSWGKCPIPLEPRQNHVPQNGTLANEKDSNLWSNCWWLKLLTPFRPAKSPHPALRYRGGHIGSRSWPRPALIPKRTLWVKPPWEVNGSRKRTQYLAFPPGIGLNLSQRVQVWLLGG